MGTMKKALSVVHHDDQMKDGELTDKSLLIRRLNATIYEQERKLHQLQNTVLTCLLFISQSINPWIYHNVNVDERYGDYNIIT